MGRREDVWGRSGRGDHGFVNAKQEFNLGGYTTQQDLIRPIIVTNKK